MMHRKQFAIILFCITVFTTAMQQPVRYPVKRIYGYKQPITQGVKNQNKNTGLSEKQFIYLLIKQSASIDIAHVWLNCTEMDFSVENAQAPVIVTFDHATQKNRKRTLVPKRDGILQQIILKGKNQNSVTAIPKHLNLYELMIAYRHNGKTYYLGQQKLNTIQAEINP